MNIFLFIKYIIEPDMHSNKISKNVGDNGSENQGSKGIRDHSSPRKKR
jgi:hypothetical protein